MNSGLWSLNENGLVNEEKRNKPKDQTSKREQKPFNRKENAAPNSTMLHVKKESQESSSSHRQHKGG